MPLEFEVAQEFEQSPREVFQALTDLDRFTEWVPGLLALERLDQGPVGPETRWKETRTFLGKEATEEYEIVTFGPPSVLAVRAHGSRGGTEHGEYIFRYRITPEGSGCKVTLHGQVRGLSGIAKWLSHLFARTYRSARAQDLEALAEHLNGDAASS